MLRKNKKIPSVPSVGVLKRAACEPSSWAGLGSVALGLKVLLPQYAGLLDGAAMLAGVVGVCMKEGRYCTDIQPTDNNAG